MATRRAFLAGGSACFVTGTAIAASSPGSRTADGYLPPSASRDLLANVRFDKAARVGKNYSARFARWDAHVGERHDPSNCKEIYEIPNGAKASALFWESKMAVDTDGPTDIPGDDPTHQKTTSLMFKNGMAIDALAVPYFVVPSNDRIDKNRNIFPAGPWEDSGDDFVSDFNLTLGNLGAVVFAGRVTGALFADTGPAMKIGEASIRVHELVRGPKHPWKGDVPRRELDPNDGAEGKVLYFVFRDLVFDINEFDPRQQTKMAEHIQTRGLAAFQDFISAQTR